MQGGYAEFEQGLRTEQAGLRLVNLARTLKNTFEIFSYDHN